MQARSKRKLLAASLSSAIAFGAVEIGLRLVDYAPMQAALGGKGQVLRTSANPRLRYELTPSTEGEGWGTYVEINSHGFRDREYAIEKGARRRICVVGDSITFGNHLAPEETYADVLERALLKEGGTPIDVLNLGVGGYDTVQEVAMLEGTGLNFSPDLVVVGFCVNDLGIVSVTMEHSWNEADRENPLYGSRIAQGIRSYFDERKRRRQTQGWNSDEVYAKAFTDQIVDVTGDEGLRERIERLKDSLSKNGKGGQAPAADVLARRIPPRWFASPVRVGRFVFALDRLRELADEHGFQVALLIVPYLAPEPGFDQAYEIVRYLAEARGIDVLEVRAAFEEIGLEELRIDPEDPVHPDARGHAILAEKLVDYVGTLGWRMRQ